MPERKRVIVVSRMIINKSQTPFRVGEIKSCKLVRYITELSLAFLSLVLSACKGYNACFATSGGRTDCSRSVN